MASAAEPDLTDSIDETVWFGLDDADRVDEDARASVAAEVARVSGLKPFPVIAQKVLTELQLPEFSTSRAAALLESDPALASLVLRLVNSAMYGKDTPCRAVEPALVRLGAKRVRDLVAGAATMQMFEGAKGLAGTFRDHCATAAAVVRVLAHRLELPGAEDLFLAGLLHDVGKLLLVETREFDYLRLPAAAIAQPNAVHGLERAALGYDHAVLGAAILRSWTIPDPIPAIVGWHHQPIRAYAAGGAIASQVSVLRVADAVSWFLARTAQVTPKFLGFLERSPDADWLSLRAPQIEEMWTEMADARSEMLAIFATGVSRPH